MYSLEFVNNQTHLKKEPIQIFLYFVSSLTLTLRLELVPLQLGSITTIVKNHSWKWGHSILTGLTGGVWPFYFERVEREAGKEGGDGGWVSGGVSGSREREGRWIIDSCVLPPVSFAQTKNASHFAAWSSCLISHEMYRKTQLASGKSTAGGKSFPPLGTGGHGQQVGGEDVALSRDEDEFEKWVGKTKKTISGLKGGEFILPKTSFFFLLQELTWLLYLPPWTVSYSLFDRTPIGSQRSHVNWHIPKLGEIWLYSE